MTLKFFLKKEFLKGFFLKNDVILVLNPRKSDRLAPHWRGGMVGFQINERKQVTTAAVLKWPHSHQEHQEI